MTRTRGSLIVIALASLAVLGFVLWSLWAELDQITRARGQVIPTGRVQTVQAASEGTVNSILVKEGDHVAKGQLLVALDQVSVGAAVEEGKARVAALKATMARIEAELFNKPLSFPSDVLAFPELANNQRMLLQSRRAALNADISALSSQLSLAQQELNLNRPLVKSGDIARAELLRLQRSVSDLSGQIASRRSRYLEDLQAEYAKTQEELTTAEQALTQRNEQLSNAELRAPAAGVVSNLRISTVGAVLRPGDEVMQIIPAGARLIVEAHLSPAEIAFIRPGQDAVVKVSAYDSSVYGHLDGKVERISADTIVDDKGEAAQRPETYYRVMVRTDKNHLGTDANPLPIIPGMIATVEVLTGKKSVLDYLMRPARTPKQEALREH